MHFADVNLTVWCLSFDKLKCVLAYPLVTVKPHNLTYISCLVTSHSLYVLDKDLEMLGGEFLQRVAILEQPNLPRFIKFPAIARIALFKLCLMTSEQYQVIESFNASFLCRFWFDDLVAVYFVQRSFLLLLNSFALALVTGLFTH